MAKHRSQHSKDSSDTATGASPSQTSTADAASKNSAANNSSSGSANLDDLLNGKGSSDNSSSQLQPNRTRSADASQIPGPDEKRPDGREPSTTDTTDILPDSITRDAAAPQDARSGAKSLRPDSDYDNSRSNDYGTSSDAPTTLEGHNLEVVVVMSYGLMTGFMQNVVGSSIHMLGIMQVQIQ